MDILDLCLPSIAIILLNPFDVFLLIFFMLLLPVPFFSPSHSVKGFK